MSIKGKIMIRKGNEHQAPAVVFVSHWNPTYEWWVTPELNTPSLLFSKEEDLIPFNYKESQRMYYQWKIANQEKLTERLKVCLSEYQ